MTRSVVMLSGGIDSTVALWQTTDPVLAVSVFYGQRHRKEIRSAEEVAQLRGVPFRIETISPLAGSALTDLEMDIPDAAPTDRAQDVTIVPGRNALLLALGVSAALEVGAEQVVFGCNLDDRVIYPDCRPSFFEAFDRVARCYGVRISTPLADLSKREVIEVGRRIGAPLEKTWSCYRGEDEPCGRCGPCRA